MSGVVFSSAQSPLSTILLRSGDPKHPNPIPRVHRDPPPLAFGEKRRIAVNCSVSGAPSFGQAYEFSIPRTEDNLKHMWLHYTVGAITGGGDTSAAFVDGAGLTLATAIEFKFASEVVFRHNADTLFLRNRFKRRPAKNANVQLGLGMPRSQRVSAASAAQQFWVHLDDFAEEGLPVFLLNQNPVLRVELAAALASINQISTTTGLEVAASAATYSITSWELVCEFENLNENDRNALIAERLGRDPRTGFPGIVRKFRCPIRRDAVVVGSSDTSLTYSVQWGAPVSSVAVLLRTNNDLNTIGKRFRTFVWTTAKIMAGSENFVPQIGYGEQVVRVLADEMVSHQEVTSVLDIPYWEFSETFDRARTSTGHFNPQILTAPEIIIEFAAPGAASTASFIMEHETFWAIAPDGSADKLHKA